MENPNIFLYNYICSQFIFRQSVCVKDFLVNSFQNFIFDMFLRDLILLVSALGVTEREQPDFHIWCYFR